MGQDIVDRLYTTLSAIKKYIVLLCKHVCAESQLYVEAPKFEENCLCNAAAARLNFAARENTG